jgi:hypothetical protein
MLTGARNSLTHLVAPEAADPVRRVAEALEKAASVRLSGPSARSDGPEVSPFKVTKPREFYLLTFDYCQLLATTEAILATTAPDPV